jgi:ferredoxin
MSTLIIGSGLSALAVYKALLDLADIDVEISQIDPNQRYSKKSSETFKLTAQKTFFGSTHMYQYIESTPQSKAKLGYSHAAGGLSIVWGAGIRLWDEKLLSLLPIDSSDIYKAAQNLLSVVPYFGSNRTLNLPLHFPIQSIPSPDARNAFRDIPERTDNCSLKIFDTPLAVTTQGLNGCKGCGLCLTGCPYGSIFSTDGYFDQLHLQDKIIKIHGRVTNLDPKESNVEVTFVNGSNKIEKKTFDQVYLCAGSIGTPAILMQSELIPNELEIKDSQAFYFLGINLRKVRNDDFAFSLSQKTITDVDNFSASLYECNSEVRSRMSNVISEKLFGLRLKLPRMLDRFIFLGIGFLDSELSGRIKLQSDSKNVLKVSTVPNSKTPYNVTEAIKVISKGLRPHGLWVVPWLKSTPPIGEGYHSGAGLPAGSIHVDNSGRLKSANNIHIADASLLPRIFAGSHTFNSMAFNYSLVAKSER